MNGGMTLQPTTPKEFFNMKHSLTINVIERRFGLLKGRWAILREKSFYPLKTQIRIITAYCLLHNHIRIKNDTRCIGNGFRRC